MRQTWICIAATAAILSVGSIAWAAKDAATTPAAPKEIKQRVAVVQKPAVADANEMKKMMAGKLEAVKKAFESEIASWKDVRKIAEEEKATKTIAAIDKIIGAKEEALKKQLAMLEKPLVPQAGEPNKPALKAPAKN
jgi:hypothetical protein